MTLSKINSELFRNDFYKNPYPTYDYLRKNHPVLLYNNEILPPCRLITQFNHCNEILTQSHFIRAYDKYNNIPDEHYFYGILKKMFLVNDPPKHTEIRSFFANYINKIPQDSIEKKIEIIVERILSKIKDKKEFDVVSEFAFIVPYIFIANLLGFPVEQAEEIRLLSQDMLRGTDKGLTFNKQMDGPNRSALELYKITDNLISERKKSPTDDLISKLIEGNEVQKLLTRDELIANIMLLLMAGHETTTSGIASGIMLFINNPAVTQQIISDPDLIKNAVEEILRLESPVQVTFRESTIDVTLDNIEIKKGEQIAVIMGAANRDPQEFEDPNAFLLSRKKNNHFAFGKGIHYCLGNQIARLEIQIALNAFLKTFSNIHELKITNFEWNNFFSFRSLKNLTLKH